MTNTLPSPYRLPGQVHLQGNEILVTFTLFVFLCTFAMHISIVVIYHYFGSYPEVTFQVFFSTFENLNVSKVGALKNRHLLNYSISLTNLVMVVIFLCLVFIHTRNRAFRKGLNGSLLQFCVYHTQSIS